MSSCAHSEENVRTGLLQGMRVLPDGKVVVSKPMQAAARQLSRDLCAPIYTHPCFATTAACS